MSFKLYSSYRDSQVPWVGPLPSHWDVVPMVAIASECDRPNQGMVENNLLSLSYGRIVTKDIAGNDGLLPESFETYQIVEPNDVVWRLTDLQNDKRSLRTALVGERGIITSAYLATTPNSIDAEFFAYLLRAYDLQKVFYSMGGGLRQGMKWSDVKRLPILLPPPAEQRQIAAFLDRETAKIDALVEEQRRLIELLKEKRQAVISHAVTKGLNPSHPTKDSGVEWLGDVPAHWEMRRAKHIFRKSALPPPDEAEVVTCFRDGQVTLRRNRREDGFTFAILEAGYQGVRPGQLVLHSMDAFAGAIGVSDSEGKCSPEYLVCDPLHRGTVPEYYGNLLRLMASRGFILAVCPSVRERAPRIRFPDFADLMLPLPHAGEQAAIARYVKDEISRLATLQVTSGRAIELLQERRAALISAAVTGKIDVRSYSETVEAA